MKSSPNSSKASRILKLLALLALLFFAVVSFLLLFSLVPMLLFGGNVQLDSGGFLDFLLRRTQHASAIIPAKLVFLGALPLLLDVLLLLAECAVIYSFLRQVTRRGTWFFPTGKLRWSVAAVLGALIAAVPPLTSAAIHSAVASSGTFAVRPWNPAGGIVFFALTLAAAVIYFIKDRRRLPLQTDGGNGGAV